MEIKLNLIPPRKKKEIERRRRVRLALKAEFVLTAIFLVFFSALFSFRYVLDVELASESSLDSEVEMADQFSEIRDYDNKIIMANEKTKQIISIDNGQLYWSRIFIKLSHLVSSGITIESLATADYTVTISGIADRRDNLLKFKDVLEKEDCFSNIDLPLSSLVNKDNIDFQIIFEIKEGCLKRGD